MPIYELPKKVIRKLAAERKIAINDEDDIIVFLVDLLEPKDVTFTDEKVIVNSSLVMYTPDLTSYIKN